MLDVLVFDSRCVAPEIFQVVKPAGFWIEDMYYRIEVVHTDPFGMLGALDMAGAQLDLIAEATLDIARDTAYLGRRVTLADNKIVYRSVVDGPEVQQHDVFTLDISNAIDNQILQAAGNGAQLSCFLSSYQKFSF